MSGPSALLELSDLRVTFASRGKRFDAISGVSLTLGVGETLALVGESGSGKSTTARAIAQLPRPSGGRVMFDGVELTALSARAVRRYRGRIGMVFQDPVSSLNPRRSIAGILDFPLRRAGLHSAAERAVRTRELMEQVGLHPSLLDRRPHELSGGQCQRVSIARALAGNPAVLLCDEVVSGLDVSVQAQILNLLQQIKRDRGLAMVFIAHDLSVVRHLADRVAVMYLGNIIETGPVDQVFAAPRHPYTAALLSAVPEPDPSVRPSGRALTGEIPSPISPPSGCRFRTRCPIAVEHCAAEMPLLEAGSGTHPVACHYPLDPTDARDEADGT